MVGLPIEYRRYTDRLLLQLNFFLLIARPYVILQYFFELLNMY